MYLAVNQTLRLRWFESITAHVTIKIVRAVQTAMACPSQWDLWDDQGNYYYARYRHGCGDVRQYKSEHWTNAPQRELSEEEKTPGWFWRANEEYIGYVAGFDTDDPWDGMMDLPEFCQRAGLELSDDLMHTNYGEHLRDKLVTEHGMTFLLENNEEGNECGSGND